MSTLQTFSYFSSFLLAMTIHSDAQRRAQTELDAVVGKDRLPNFSDRESLPYVNALIKECLRWHSAVPLVVPHSSMQDDIYGVYHIPGGSTLMPNAW